MASFHRQLSALGISPKSQKLNLSLGGPRPHFTQNYSYKTAKLETSCTALSEVQAAKLEVATWAEVATSQCLQTWPWSAKCIPLPALPKLLGTAIEERSVLGTRLAVLATDLPHHYFVYSSSNLIRGPTTSTLEEIWLLNLGVAEQTLGTAQLIL